MLNSYKIVVMLLLDTSWADCHLRVGKCFSLKDQICLEQRDWCLQHSTQIWENLTRKLEKKAVHGTVNFNIYFGGGQERSAGWKNCLESMFSGHGHHVHLDAGSQSVQHCSHSGNLRNKPGNYAWAPSPDILLELVLCITWNLSSDSDLQSELKPQS